MSKAAENDQALNILIIDDEPVVLESLENFLKSRSHKVFTASRGQEGIALLLREQIDVVITDICMPAMDGFEVLQQVKQFAPEAEVIVVTGHGDIDAAVRALREGAFDFFSKPIKLRELSASLQRTIRFHALRQEKNRYQERLSYLTMEGSKNYGVDAIIGESPLIQRVKDLIQLVCNTEATTVLICGETGTGKELVARALHYGSHRGTGPFVPVDCTAIPETLIESDLYGHMKGAFTDAKEARKGCFELADGGTLFLDEIGDMAPLMQAKLLRTLEQRCIRRVGGGHEIPVDVRVVSATNRDLSQATRCSQFREDLYYRLNTITIHIPPLRERREDIPLLARWFLRRYIRELRKPIEGYTPEAEGLLCSYSFPGNIRELRNTIERAAILCTGTHILPQDLCLDQTQTAKATDQPADTRSSSSQHLSNSLSVPPRATLDLATLEKQAIQEALSRTNNNQVQAANLLGVSRTALRRRLQRCGGKQ